jgi:hypothetical protein
LVLSEQRSNRKVLKKFSDSSCQGCVKDTKAGVTEAKEIRTLTIYGRPEQLKKSKRREWPGGCRGDIRSVAVIIVCSGICLETKTIHVTTLICIID